MNKTLTLYIKRNTVFEDFIKGLIKKEEEELAKKLKEVIDNLKGIYIRKIEKIRKKMAVMGEGYDKLILEFMLENTHKDLTMFNSIFHKVYFIALKKCNYDYLKFYKKMLRTFNKKNLFLMELI